MGKIGETAKAAIKQVLGNVIGNDETLITAIPEVEALLNARPLTHVPVDPSEPVILTPIHFLLGRASANLASVFVEKYKVRHKGTNGRVHFKMSSRP